MGMITAWVRVDLRRRWRPLVVLALLIAISAGTVLAAVAGARRAASAVDRLLDVTLPATAVVSPFQPSFDWDAVRTLPQVEALTTYPYYAEFSIDEAPDYPALPPFVPADSDAMRVIERPAVLAGRLADPSRADEAVVTANFVRTFARGVGDSVTVRLRTPQQAESSIKGGIGQGTPAGPVVRVRIVGVIRSPYFSDDAGSTGSLVPSPGLLATYRANLQGPPGVAPVNALVRLRAGEADLAAFRTELARVTGRPDIDVLNRADFVRREQDVLGFESGCLLVFGLTALLAAVVLLGQSINRYVAVTVADLQVLRAVGMTRNQATLAASAGPFLAAGAGTALGVGGAVVASWWIPFGTASAYEPVPGVDADWLVLAAGLVVIPALVLAGAVIASWVALPAADRRASGRGSLVARAAARAGLPAPIVVGARFALEPGGRGTVPVRPALVGAVTGVLGVLAAFTFSAGVDDAGKHPQRFGQVSQLAAVFGFGGRDFAPPKPLMAVLAADPDVTGVNDTRLAAADSGLTSIPTFSYNPVGELPLVLTEGRTPAAADEVVLATTTARRLGAQVGSVVPFTGDAGTQLMRITGIGFVWQTLYNDYDNGAWATAGGYDRLFTGFKQHGALLVLRPGADLAVVLPRLQHTAATVEGGQGLLFLSTLVPRQLGEIQNIRVLPVVLGGFLALLAVGAVGHALTTAVRRRQHDLAVLRALGMTRWQVRGVVVTHASVLAAIGLLFGIPLGLALGRTLWRVAAHSTPLLYVPPVAFWALVLIVPLALLIANLLAGPPGQRAARLRIGQVLRAE